MSAGNVIADPNITIGPYRVLTRTDGKWILVDDRLPLGERTAAIRTSKDAILACAERLVSEGSPIVSAPAADIATSGPRTSSTATSSRGTSRKSTQAGFALSDALTIGASRIDMATHKRKRTS